MANTAPQPRPGEQENDAALRWVGNVAIASLPVLACFLGGATQKWAEGIVVAFLGLILIVRPPRFSLGPLTNGVFLAFVLLACVAFLPTHYFFSSTWRSAMINDLGIALPDSVTPQPWISLGCLFSLVAGASWLYLVSTQEIELRSVRFQLRVFATGIVVLAAVSILFYLAHLAPPFWINERGFGPFPNRNQTGDLFALTAIVILACGQDDIRKGRKRWILWLAALGVIVTAIILNFSRAGIFILVVGSALWLGTFALRQRSMPRLALGFSFVLLLLTVLLLFGGQTLERFHLRGLASPGISTDFRWRIFRDTFGLIRDSPWCGIGLGNFESVFAIFRNASFGDTRALHPESDWLWVWTEMGWPSVLLVVVGVALLIRRVFPLREGTNQRYRLATLIAAVLFAFHGLVDVSGHRVGTALAGMFLLGLSLHRPLCLKSSRAIPVVFRLVGLILLAAGGTWMVAAHGRMLLPGSVGVANAKQLAAVANRGLNFSEAAAISTHGLEWAPLDWQLYFARAIAEVNKKQTQKALDDFRRARFLEPNAYEVPLTEGDLWLNSHPVLAITAWREALRRAGPHRAEVYSSMLTNASMKNPQVSRVLEKVGLSQHDLAIAYLSRVSPQYFDHALNEFLKHDPDLKTLSEGEKLVLFSLWSEHGNLDHLASAVAQHPKWLEYAWLGMAKYYARKNDFRDAYELTQRYGEPVALPRVEENASIQELQRRFYAVPDNYGAGYALYRAQMKSGRVDDALFTARHFSERPGTPAYFHFLEAQCWAEKQNWERAWNAWFAFHTATTRVVQ
jgi:O-antigen ligase/tetratricopeptide (TPR) repeat protein